MQLPDELAARIRPMHRWLPTVLELSLAGFKSSAAETAAEIIEFLSAAPSNKQVLAFHVSERAQSRLDRLLTLNQANLLGEQEQLELDELEKIEHIITNLKLNLASKTLSS